VSLFVRVDPLFSCRTGARLAHGTRKSQVRFVPAAWRPRGRGARRAERRSPAAINPTAASVRASSRRLVGAVLTPREGLARVPASPPTP